MVPLKLAVLVGFICSSGIMFPVVAQSVCTPLNLVGSKHGLHIDKKTISAPTTGSSITNWNSEFEIPGGKSFPRYVATIKTSQKGSYDLKMALAYPDGNAKTYVEKTGHRMSINGTYKMTALPDPKAQPYRVRVLTGGKKVQGKVVKIQVDACT